MDTRKREGIERLYYILKYYRKLAKKIQKLYPEEDLLCRAYQNLDKAFDGVIEAESKYQVDFLLSRKKKKNGIEKNALNEKVDTHAFIESMTEAIQSGLKRCVTIR